MAAVLETLMDALPEIYYQHSPGSNTYRFLKQVARQEVERMFADPEPHPVDFLPFGSLTLPYHRMGAVDSLNLFDLDELIIFSYYWLNRGRYRRVADIGANIGLHSILLCKCGFEVRAYEPDPQHFAVLERNLELNQCQSVEVHNVAVSSRIGEMEFVRVLGNTTGSHLAGSKLNPYGQLERFPVSMESFESIIEWADLIKLDAEGHEKEIVLASRHEHWLDTDALIEVENPDNGAALFDHLRPLGVNLFSQKTGWGRVEEFVDMPNSYREGTLFISCKAEMPWKR